MDLVANFIPDIYGYLTHNDDTSIDRLNRLYTVAILSTFVTLISSQQHVVGGRIVCWTPSEFTDPQIAYASEICWLGKSNYHVAGNVTRLESPLSTRDNQFIIYPWLPIILIGMTVGFIAPYLLIWHGLSARSGINIKRLIAIRERNDLARAIHYILFRRYEMKGKCGFYVSIIYLLMKLCYIINLFCQIILINKILLGNYLKINFDTLFEILSVKYNMWSSAYLPIEVMCDFMIRMLGQNNNWFTVQCILPFNLFAKRIFALLLIWFIIILVISIFDFLYVWLWKRVYSSRNRYNYVMNLFCLYRKYLNRPDDNETFHRLEMTKSSLVDDFIRQYLHMDGYLLLNILHNNLSDVQISDLVMKLFNRFLEEKNEQSTNVENRTYGTIV